MPEYTHMLIPDRVDFVPDPRHVGTFLASLEWTGAAPLKPAVTASRFSGTVRSLANRFTGRMEAYAMRKAEAVHSLADVPRVLKGFDDYTLTVAGNGPPRLSAFEFDYAGVYDFLVQACLRAGVESRSDPYDEVTLERGVAFFGRPCDAGNRSGTFHHPSALEVIEVPSAGCARFCIEFGFGNLLFPAIAESMVRVSPGHVLKPSISPR